MAEKDLVKEQIIGLGMGLPAPVNEDGIVQNTANLGWGYKEVTRELEELLDGMKVIPGNDANVAALGEMWKGGGKGHKNVIMVTLGTGVGGGIIVDGKCLVGAHGAGGEIGHLCVNYQETETCGCGKKGCLEQYASATGITRLANMRLAKDEKPSTLRNVAEMSAKEVFGLTIKGVTVKQGQDGLFCNLPQYYSEKDGYRDVVRPTSKRIREAISEAVLQEYKVQKNRRWKT